MEAAGSAWLGYRGTMPMEMAADRRAIELSHIYVAPSDYHLMIDRSYVYITYGPRENMTECGGPLWQLKDDKIPDGALAAEISNEVERSLWGAVNMMDERTRTLEHLATTGEQEDRRRSASLFRDRDAENREHTERLRQLLLSIHQ